MPTISIIVPVYNVENYIHRCIDSILTQTYRDFELILVDDGSPDNCGAICDEYSAKDGRIVVIHQKNGGLSAARNAGIDWVFANSDSEWLTFVDSDDWIHPEYLERLLSAAISNNVGLSICAYSRTEGIAVPAAEAKQSAVWNPEEYYVAHRTNAIVAWGKLYQKSSFLFIRFPVGKIHEDEFTTYKILFSQEAVAVDETPLYYYFFNSSGIVNSAWSPARLAAIEAMEEQIDFFLSNGYFKALKRAVQATMYAIHSSVIKIDYFGKQYVSYKNVLKKKMAFYIKHYKGTLDIRINNYCFAYETAYPILMKLYWLCRALFYKIKNLFNYRFSL